MKNLDHYKNLMKRYYDGGHSKEDTEQYGKEVGRLTTDEVTDVSKLKNQDYDMHTYGPESEAEREMRILEEKNYADGGIIDDISERPERVISRTPVRDPASNRDPAAIYKKGSKKHPLKEGMQLFPRWTKEVEDMGIDPEFIARKEAISTELDIPMHKGTSTPIQRSGVTVGPGVDLGQRSLEEIASYGLSPKFDKYKSLIGKEGRKEVDGITTHPVVQAREEWLDTHRGSDWRKGSKEFKEAKQIAPEDLEDFDILAQNVFKKLYSDLEKRYNEASPSIPLEQLPKPVKSALMSLAWQRPNFINNSKLQKALKDGDFNKIADAIEKLSPSFKDRRKEEADHIREYLKKEAFESRPENMATGFYDGGIRQKEVPGNYAFGGLDKGQTEQMYAYQPRLGDISTFKPLPAEKTDFSMSTEKDKLMDTSLSDTLKKFKDLKKSKKEDVGSADPADSGIDRSAAPPATRPGLDPELAKMGYDFTPQVGRADVSNPFGTGVGDLGAIAARDGGTKRYYDGGSEDIIDQYRFDQLDSMRDPFASPIRLEEEAEVNLRESLSPAPTLGEQPTEDLLGPTSPEEVTDSTVSIDPMRGPAGAQPIDAGTTMQASTLPSGAPMAPLKEFEESQLIKEVPTPTDAIEEEPSTVEEDLPEELPTEKKKPLSTQEQLMEIYNNLRKEREANRKRALVASGIASFGRAFESLYAGIPGVKTDYAFWDNLGKQARSLASKNKTDAFTELTKLKKALMGDKKKGQYSTDPNSQESISARNSLRHIGVHLPKTYTESDVNRMGKRLYDQRVNDEKSVRTTMDKLVGIVGARSNVAKILMREKLSRDGLRIIKMIEDGKIAPTYQIAEELAGIMSTLLQGGNQATRSATEALVPKTLWGDKNRIAQYLFNQPKEFLTSEFTNHFKHQIENQYDFWKGELDKTSISAYHSLAPIFRREIDGKRINDDLLKDFVKGTGVEELRFFKREQGKVYLNRGKTLDPSKLSTEEKAVFERAQQLSKSNDPALRKQANLVFIKLGQKYKD